MRSTRYFTRMKTITISLEDELYDSARKEAEKRRKSLSELFHDLLAGLRSQKMPAAASDRHAWLARLAGLRQRGSTGRQGTPLQQIMDDLRGN